MAASAYFAQVQQMYIAYFGRPADVTGQQHWANVVDAAGGSFKILIDGFSASAESAALFGGKSNIDMVTSIYQNLFNRAPETEGLKHWVAKLDSGELTAADAASTIQKLAGPGDDVTVQNKLAAAQAFTDQMDTAAEIQGYQGADAAASARAFLATVTQDTATLTAAVSGAAAAVAVAGAAGAAAGVAGETFTLTTGADTGAAFTGTAGNDTFTSGETFLALNSSDEKVYTSHLNSTDVINGGAGTDTLKVTTEGAIAKVSPTMTSVENIELSSGKGITFDTTDYADVALLKATKAAGNVELTAAATADISISGVAGTATIDAFGGKNVTITDAAGTGTITVGNSASGIENYAAGDITVTDSKQSNDVVVDGGADVTVTTTSKVASGDIIVGANQEATGAVVVTQNLTSTGDDLDNSLNAIEVTGGTTVDVTINGAITADATANSHALTAGDVVVTGDGTTTNVNVVQNLTETDFFKAGAVEVVATEVVTFKALAKGEFVTVAGLTFTTAKALTAVEVAQAFTGLTEEDAQTATGFTANGSYTGDLDAGWTTAAAAGAAVTFTGAASGTAEFTPTSDATVAPTKVYTAGTAAVADTTADVSTVFGDVTIDEDATAAASIESITLNGFADATLGNTNSLDALTTLNLSNSDGDIYIESTSKTLTLNLDNIDTQDLDMDSAGVETLTITTTGTASNIDLEADGVKSLTIDAGVALSILTGGDYEDVLETVTIKGAGAVDLDDISGAVNLKSFSAADNTGGVTATVETEIAAGALTGDIAEYVFSAGADDVTLSNAVIETKITLGAGDDKLTLANGTVASAAALNGGTGTNTIAMTADVAQALSSTNVFEAKMSNFSKLEVGAVAAGTANTVDLANMDDISYVITAGTSDNAEVTTVAITVDADVVADNTASITIDGTTYTTAALSVEASASDIATAIDTAVGSGFTVIANSGVLSITGANGKQVSVTDLKINLGTALTAGAISSVNTVISSELFISNMANNGTVELTGTGMGATVAMTDASGSADALNVVTQDDAHDVNLGTVLADDVETINVITQDTFTDLAGDGVDDTNSSVVLNLSGDALKTVAVTGAGDVTLSATSTLLTSVNASTLTGALTYVANGATAGTTVIAGSGNDVLTAFGENDVLQGGAGNDTFNLTDLTQAFGGTGSDIFNFAVNSNLSKVSTINDLATGDTINLVDVYNDGGAAAVVTNFYAAGAQYNANTTTDVAGKVNAALLQTGEGEASWFNHGSNTYVVIDAAGDNVAAGAVDTYVAGQDIVIEIVGTFNLGTDASFNATYGTLEVA